LAVAYKQIMNGAYLFTLCSASTLLGGLSARFLVVQKRLRLNIVQAAEDEATIDAFDEALAATFPAGILAAGRS
jgi:hypothetical protein